MRSVSSWLRVARWGSSSDWSALRSKPPQIRPDEAVDEVDELVIEGLLGLWVFRWWVCGGLSMDCGGGFAVMVGLWVFRWWFAVDFQWIAVVGLP